MSRDADVMEDILNEARFDWIDMGHAIGIVSIDEGGDDDLALFERAGRLVVRLVREGRLVPGDIGKRPGSFIAWPLSPTDASQVLGEYVDDVLVGRRPLEPWQPCMFADAESESLERGRREMQERRAVDE